MNILVKFEVETQMQLQYPEAAYYNENYIFI